MAVGTYHPEPEDFIMTRILICGDRDWTNRRLIEKFIDLLKPDHVIEGGARGADTIAREVCEDRNIDFLDMPADWDMLGNSAGPVRNREMLKEGQRLGLDYVLAFHNDIKRSKGTADMVAIASKAGIPVVIISEGIGGTAVISFVSSNQPRRLI